MMARFLYHSPAIGRRRMRLAFLAAFWILGLVCGWLLYVHGDYNVVSLMRGAMEVPVSIVGLVNVLAVPFLFSALAVFISGFSLLPIVALEKGMLFAFTSCCVLGAFGNGGWLMWSLLMFSDIIGVILLWYFWLRVVRFGRIFPFEGILPAGAGLILTGMLDICVISPFIAGI